jgi:magnesium-transporting ATPase (P-type)
MTSDSEPIEKPAPPWHAESPALALARLDVSENRGLSAADAGRRLARHGPNQLPPPERRGPVVRFLLQFHNPLIYVLLAAAAITYALEDYIDAIVIMAVVIINAVIGFVQEGKAERALEAVRAMLASRASVVREGERREIREIDAREVVPGDIVLLESGARVPVDLRLLRAKNLQITNRP